MHRLKCFGERKWNKMRRTDVSGLIQAAEDSASEASAA